MTLTIDIPAWLPWAAGNASGLAALFFLLRRKFARLLQLRSTLWLVGRHVRGNHWDVQGVFSRKDAAIAACKNARYFLFPLTLDQELPENTSEPFAIEYPKGHD